MLNPGDFAPDFELANQNGEKTSFSQFGGKPVVIFFYPKDGTPGCTAQSCSFRDNHTGFKALGAEVIGISSDPVDSHKEFANKHSLPYPILSDDTGRVKKLFGVKNTFGLLPGRATFVVDKNGKIVHTYVSQFHAARHVDEALQAVQRLAR